MISLLTWWKFKSRSSELWCRVVCVPGYKRFGGPCCLYLQGEGAGNMILSPCRFRSHPEDRRRTALRNVGILPQHYTASQPGSSLDFYT